MNPSCLDDQETMYLAAWGLPTYYCTDFGPAPSPNKPQSAGFARDSHDDFGSRGFVGLLSYSRVQAGESGFWKALCPKPMWFENKLSEPPPPLFFAEEHMGSILEMVGALTKPATS